MPVSRGNLPKFATEQINPPKAPPLEEPKIHIDPTVNVQPDLRMSQIRPPQPRHAQTPPSSAPLSATVAASASAPETAEASAPAPAATWAAPSATSAEASPPPSSSSPPSPSSPKKLAAAKVSGNILVTLQVDAQGRPTHVRILRGIGLGLDQKAIEAVSQYKFKPALENGRPVPVEMNVEVNFQIF